jgi:hypothetical protein
MSHMQKKKFRLKTLFKQKKLHARLLLVVYGFTIINVDINTHVV